MEGIIKIEDKDGKSIVNARELHAFLEIITPFKDWIKRVISIGGFKDGIDFSTFLRQSTGGRPATEYPITADMARHISMMQRTPKGEEARDYFLKIEKEYKNILQSLPKTFPDALRLLAVSKEKEEIVTKALMEANTKIKEDESKVVFAESVSGSDNLILVRHFAKELSDSGFKIGEKRLFKWFRFNGYLSNQNEPYMRYVDQDLFKVITRAIGGPESTFTSRTTKITGKGQVYFAKKIKESYEYIN